MTDPRPLVSVVIPCRNEERTIGLVLDALDRQTYPRGRMEVIVADGYSADDTRGRVRAYAGDHPTMPVRLIDNPGLTAPVALNAGVRESKGEIILRMDAHAVPDPDYVEQSVRALAENRCEAVGGMWEIQPGAPGIVARAIATAVASPFATGGVRYRSGGKPGEVDTVPFGAFRRNVFDRVGFFNEQVPINEDYEFFYRIRAAGGRIYFSPEIRSRYIARADVRSLVAQYFLYGRQKAAMLSFHPRSLRLRQLVPAVFVLSLVGLALGSAFFPPLAILLGAEAALYFAAIAGFSLREALRKKNLALAAILPWVFACIHTSWGLGFWVGIGANFGRFFHGRMGEKERLGKAGRVR
jgi:glycosyltransferase involved in cell wall biosynthesis